MRWLKHRGGAQHHARWKGAGKREPLPAAAVIGADPGTILAAVTPVPDTLSEYQFAGLLRGTKVELVDCKTVPLKVPAEAEIVLEGHVSLDDYGDEGPYGDHTGYYNASSSSRCSPFSAITMRRQPIYLSTFTGRPPDEPCVLGEALNEVFIPLFQQQFPEIVDFWLPPEGCCYRIAVVSMKKAYAGHAKRVMMGVWSLPAAVHVHEVGDRGGRRHRRAQLEGRDVGGLDPHGPGARHHRDREHADRLSRLRLARSRASAPRSASTPPTNSPARPTASGAARSAWTRRSSTRSTRCGARWDFREAARRSGASACRSRRISRTISGISAVRSRFECRGGAAAQDNYRYFRHFRRSFRRAAEGVNMRPVLLSEGQKE